MRKPKLDDLYHPDDPYKGVPLSDLIKKGEFKTTLEKTDWFDETAKPKKKQEDVNFDPDPEIEKKTEDGNL